MNEKQKNEGNFSGIPLGKLFLTTVSGFSPGKNLLSIIVYCKKNSYQFQAAFVAQNTDRNQFWMHEIDGDTLIFPLAQQACIQASGEHSPAAGLNLHPQLIDEISRKLYLPFSPENVFEQKNTSPVCFATEPEVRDEFKIDVLPQWFGPLDIFDYVYAYLHCPSFIRQYQEFHAGELPVIPYPKNQIQFWKITGLGSALRKAHLASHAESAPGFILKGKGNNRIDYVREEASGNKLSSDTADPIIVRINKSQYMEISPAVWNYKAGSNFLFRQRLLQFKDAVLTDGNLQHLLQLHQAIQATLRIEEKMEVLCA